MTPISTSSPTVFSRDPFDSGLRMTIIFSSVSKSKAACLISNNNILQVKINTHAAELTQDDL